MVKVSIIVPVYNVQGYLPACLNSLIKQNLRDIEIICVNDGSTDNSLEILENFARKDKRIKVIDKQNEGPGIARNIGIKEAKGEYIGFVDPDDRIGLDMYEKMYNQAKKLGSDIVICDFIKYQEWTGKSWKHNFFIKAKNSMQDEPLYIKSGVNMERKDIYDTLLISPCYSWNRLYRTSLLKDNDILFSEKRCYEDCIFILKSHIKANMISYISEPLYIYRLRKTSLLRSQNKRYYDLFETINDLKDYLKSEALLERFDLNLHYFRVMNCVWSYQNLERDGRRELCRLVNKNFDKTEIHAFRKSLKLRLKDRIKLPFKNILSVTKLSRHTVIKFLGISLKIRNLKGRYKIEQYYIDKVKKEQKKYPKDAYLLFDCLHDVGAECIDAYSLFEEMKKEKISAYYVIRKQTKLYKQLLRENKLDNVIVLNFSTRSHPNEFIQKIYPVLLRAKAVITSFGENSGVINSFFKNNSAWQYIFIQHGSIFMKESVLYNGYLYPEKFDKFLVCSDIEYNLFKKYGFPDEKLIKVGLPRWDLLHNLPKAQEKNILLMLTWRRMNTMQFDSSMYKKNLLHLVRNANLRKYLDEHHIKLYFAPHHALLGNSKIDFDLSHENIQIIDQSEISEYIRKCSCLVTDLSSVAFDFMFQNKPVLFYILDYNDINLGRFDSKDIERFRYKKFVLPDVFFSEEEVLERLKYYVERNFKIDKETKQIYNKFFYTKTNIRKQLIKELEKIC